MLRALTRPFAAVLAATALFAAAGCTADGSDQPEVIFVESDPGGVPGDVDLVPGCDAVCSHVYDDCGSALVGGDGTGDAAECESICSAVFGDAERTCLAKAPCGRLVEICLDAEQ